MMTFDQIEDAAADYKSLSIDDLDGLETEALHQLLSQRVATECEVTVTKKSLMGSANDLLKKIRAEVQAINVEIQRRNERSLPNPDLALKGAS
ncbi:MAG TPA: hypothetical protein VE954_27360 [Oligoflexus sp.]|uniref:hypothetical protein n=1 Tax=Oligoflexus sp. TaxID=1971216 RepID=UPI002D45C5F7|nr:hypothetical protein [Oligoflexus sp.]HYX36843.1 hypothetical protein [Oligoflexus sp.]